jgi:hypothetical protein
LPFTASRSHFVVGCNVLWLLLICGTKKEIYALNASRAALEMKNMEINK